MDLHIVPINGLRMIARHFPKDRWLGIWDDLSQGPCAVDTAAHLAGRRRFWRAQRWHDWHAPWEVDLGAAVAGCERVCLWLTQALAEQMLACWLLECLNDQGIEIERIDVGPAFLPVNGDPCKDLGTLAAHDPGSQALVACRVPLNAAHAEAMRDLWRRLCAPTPEPLGAWLSASGAAPFALRKAVLSLMQRFPSLPHGLDHWQHLALSTCADFTGAGRTCSEARICVEVALVMESDPEQVAVLDAQTLRVLLRALDQEGCSLPLVHSQGDRTSLRPLELRITADGLAVLRGEKNHLLHNGIDTWIGGTHLGGDDAVWLWEDGRLMRWQRQVPLEAPRWLAALAPEVERTWLPAGVEEVLTEADVPFLLAAIQALAEWLCPRLPPPRQVSLGRESALELIGTLDDMLSKSLAGLNPYHTHHEGQAAIWQSLLDTFWQGRGEANLDIIERLLLVCLVIAREARATVLHCHWRCGAWGEVAYRRALDGPSTAIICAGYDATGDTIHRLAVRLAKLASLGAAAPAGEVCVMERVFLATCGGGEAGAPQPLASEVEAGSAGLLRWWRKCFDSGWECGLELGSQVQRCPKEV